MRSLLLTLAATSTIAPGVRWLMVRHSVMDVPNHRSSHSIPTPRGGGLACLAGILLALAVATVNGRDVPWPVIGAAVVLAGLGFVDDYASLPPAARLLAQAVVGGVCGFLVGGWLLALAGVVVFAVCVNVVNFMDGINGITALTMATWGVTAALVGHHEQLRSLFLVGALTAGAALGFLPWNAPVARLFLGDVGSYLFGALVAGGILLAWAGGAPVAVVVAPLTIYLVDTGWTLASRARRGEPLMEAHRSHVYQRLTSGPSPRPHLLVAACAALLAVVTTAAWANGVATGATVTAVVSACYLCGPRAVAMATGVDPGDPA